MISLKKEDHLLLQTQSTPLIDLFNLKLLKNFLFFWNGRNQITKKKGRGRTANRRKKSVIEEKYKFHELQIIFCKDPLFLQIRVIKISFPNYNILIYHLYRCHSNLPLKKPVFLLLEVSSTPPKESFRTFIFKIQSHASCIEKKNRSIIQVQNIQRR